MGKQLTTEEVKKMNIDILSVVADFCEKNGLRYWLYYGTLIGAIRHNGYIPWDDDIDIAMPRPDYEKFLKTFNHIVIARSWSFKIENITYVVI